MSKKAHLYAEGKAANPLRHLDNLVCVLAAQPFELFGSLWLVIDLRAQFEQFVMRFHDLLELGQHMQANLFTLRFERFFGFRVGGDINDVAVPLLLA